ncbi:MAG TPA: MBL fold metallo-hydrolase [Burkholderiales bacterium]
MPGLPEPGKLLQVADGVHWIRMPLPFALDHINLWLLRDGDGWTLVDTGFGTTATKRLWEQIIADRLDGRPVTRIIVTHLHPDHLGLAAWLAERFGVEIWMTQTEFTMAHAIWAGQGGDVLARLAQLYRRHGLPESQVAMIAGCAGAYRLAVPLLPASFRRLAAGDTVTIDDHPWRVIVGHGHSPEHAALYCEPLRVLISGDMVLPKITTNVSVAPAEPDGDPLRMFLDSLKRFGALPEDTLVLPSHGAVFHGLHQRLAQLREHHAQRFDIVLGACAEPRSAPELLPYLFKREFDAHQLSFAMGETIAHLNYLMHSKRLQRIDETDRYRFVRAAA